MSLLDRDAYNAYNRKWRAANKRRVVSHQLKYLYGITIDEYEAMLAAQGGVCKLCGRPPKRKRLHVDHEHETGRIRGLLCAHCNHKAIGAIEALGLEKVIEYLSQPSIRQKDARVG